MSSTAREHFWVAGSSGVVRWRPAGKGLEGERYQIRLLAPYEWEVIWGGEPIAVYPSRKEAVAAAEQHRREQWRRADVVRWPLVALAGALALAAVASVPQGSLLWVVALGVAMYTIVAALARWVAAVSRSRTDPYRRRLPWERRRRWWHRLVPGAARR